MRNEWNTVCGFGTTLAVVVFSAATATAAGDFDSVVRKILESQTSGQLAEMDADHRGRMTSCAIDTLGALPDGLKRKIVDGKSLKEQERLFGQVVDDNHAKWRQTIAKACGQIATAD